MKVSALAAAAAITGGIIAVGTFAPQAANASQGHIAGYDVISVNESASRTSPDFLVVAGPQGPERITVTCGWSAGDGTYDWSSNGPNTAAFVEHITQSWCF